MKAVINNSKLGNITYEESFWTGSKSIIVNGKLLKKKDKDVYYVVDGENTITYYLEGNFFKGVTIKGPEGWVQVVPAANWYELLLAISIFVFNLVWGNSKDLVSIIPIVGGAIGGAISGGFAMYSIIEMRKRYKVLTKVGAWFVCFLISVVACVAAAFIIAFLFVG